MSEIIIAALLGALLAAVITTLFLQLRHAGRSSALREQLATAQGAQQAAQQQLQQQTELAQRLREERESERQAHQQLAQEHARQQQEMQDLRRVSDDKLQLLEKAREQLREQFSALSAEILQRNSQQLAQQQNERLGHLLKPFDERLQAFHQQIKESYEVEVRERVSLKEELKRLAEQGERMTREADGLARALKGESKTRGDWGEVILQRVLEQSGLRQDQEYRVQASHHNEEGRRYQPDVVIDLPDGKHLVIDSKLPLMSWIAVCEAEDEEARQRAIKQLSVAVKGHVRGLSTKAYENLLAINSVDFVLCFIPVEAAFACAVNADADLYREAMERNVILVSPTTLLATMRTVALTWRSERQERNALRIASEAGKMYDQLVGYSESLEALGQRLDQAQRSYQQARKRLYDGRGNLLGRAEKVRNLGAKAAKRLSQDLRDHITGDGDIDDDDADDTEMEAVDETDPSLMDDSSGNSGDR